MIAVLLVPVWIGLTAMVVAAQPPTCVEPVPPATAPAARAPAAAAERAEAERLLGLLAGRSGRSRVLVADYTQRRTTALSDRPLVSRGEFVFVREPACVLFRASAPRVSLVRLTPRRYEVYRPDRKRLERILLDGPQLAEGLFAAVGGDSARLLREFTVVGCARVAPADPAGMPAVDPAVATQPEPGPVRLAAITLEPRDVAVRRQLRELVVTVAEADGELAGVAYRDASGDLIAIELRDVRADPEPAPSVELPLPDDVQIVEHRQPPAGSAAEPR